MAQSIASGASEALMTLWSLVGFTFIFVLLCLYTCMKVLRMYGADDHFYNAAFVCQAPSINPYDIQAQHIWAHLYGNKRLGVQLI